MMHGTWVEIAFFLLMVYITSANTESCPKLGLSVENVPSCPKDGGEWKARAERKQCSRYQQCLNVGEIFYHCVINFDGNKALEICAPKIHIVGKRCVEYNRRGAIIQPSLSIKCEDCPNSYNSTDAYKYQECYNGIIKHSTELPKISTTDQEVNSQTSSPFFSYLQENSTNYVSSAWKIVAIVMITINVVLLILMLSYWLIRKHQENIKKANRKEESEGMPLIEDKVGSKKQEASTTSSAAEEGNTQTGTQRTLSAAEVNNTKTVAFRYVTAIYIGDRYLSMALSYPKAPADVQHLGSLQRMCFFRDQKGNITDFGNEAYEEYKKKAKTTDKPQELQKIRLNDDSIEDYGAVLSWIIKIAKLELFKRLPYVRPSVIYYVFVVPNYWEEDALEKLKDKCLEINTNLKDRCCVIKRELTLSPFIHEVKARAVCLNFDVDNLVLQPQSESTTYAVLHVGSSHYDLRFVKVEQNKNDREPNEGIRSVPKSSAWEKRSLPHESILNFFEHVYGDNTMKQWEKSKEFASFLYRCEELIKKTNEGTSEDQEFVLELSQELIKGDSGNEFNREKVSENPDISFGDNDWTFKIKLTWIKTFFEGIQVQINEMLKDFWNDFDTKHVKCVVMTGAHSRTKIIWDIAETVWFKDKKVTIVVPEDTHMFAMGGAYYGQKMEWSHSSTVNSPVEQKPNPFR